MGPWLTAVYQVAGGILVFQDSVGTGLAEIIGRMLGLLTVRDHGPGFPEQDLQHVSDRFYRTEAARRMPGSGLGLAIVKQAAEAHGGSVEATNAPDGGAVLRISFGAPPDQGPADGPVRQRALAAP